MQKVFFDPESVTDKYRLCTLRGFQLRRSIQSVLIELHTKTQNLQKFPSNLKGLFEVSGGSRGRNKASSRLQRTEGRKKYH